MVDTLSAGAEMALIVDKLKYAIGQSGKAPKEIFTQYSDHGRMGIEQLQNLFKGLGFEFTLAGHGFFFPIQGFGVLAMIPICLYNGKKGADSKILKHAFYWFYPVHMTAIYLISLLAS